MTLDLLEKQLRLPIIAAPMFLISGPPLVKACCRSGIVGSFPALNQRTSKEFSDWVVDIQQDLEKAKHESHPHPIAPFAVNLIVHKSNPRLQEDLAVCIKHKVPIIITSLGAVSEIVQAVHAYGGLVFHDVTNVKHAEKALQAGVDALIAVSAGAGGHAGTINPFALMAQMKNLKAPSVILAGGISAGCDVAAARVLGARFAYMGTRFIATQESSAQDDYKKMILASEAQDIVYTPQVSGINANFMKASLEKAGLSELNHTNTIGEKLALEGEAKAWKNIWSAGHGVSAIRDIPAVSDLVTQLERDFKKSLSVQSPTSS